MCIRDRRSTGQCGIVVFGFLRSKLVVLSCTSSHKCTRHATPVVQINSLVRGRVVPNKFVAVPRGAEKEQLGKPFGNNYLIRLLCLFSYKCRVFRFSSDILRKRLEYQETYKAPGRDVSSVDTCYSC